MSTGTFSLVIDNQTGKYTNDEAYIYVIGLDPNNNSVFAWLNASGTLTDATPNSSPPNLPLNASGTTTFTVPYITSGRIWISLGAPLIMPFNSSSPLGQIQPSVSNPSDPNVNTLWDFAEFNFDSTSGLFVNTTQVDAFAIPILLTLDGTVVGVDGAGWTAVQNAILANPTFSPLVINNTNGDFVRILQPNDGITYGVFGATYLDAYIDSCWTFYQTNQMIMDLTAAGFGTVVGTVDLNGNFNFLTQETNSLLKIVATIPKPTTQQAFACSGPLATGNNEPGAIQNVIAAGLNRGVLETTAQPMCDASSFYNVPATNVYSQILHENFKSNLAYGFGYDDQCNQAPTISNIEPTTLTVTIGTIS